MAELNAVSLVLPDDTAAQVLQGRVYLWRIVKALPFSGGPSATKWVYLALNMVIAMVVLLLTAAVAIIYMCTPDHHLDGGLLSTLVVLVGIVQACATLALTNRAKLMAQSDAKPDVTVVDAKS